MSSEVPSVAGSAAEKSLASHEATSPRTGKPPTQVFPDVFAFAPNRDTLGGTAYLICEGRDRPTEPANAVRMNVLVDCPALTPANLTFLREQGGVDCLFISHRGGMAQAKQWQAELDCQLVIQEQEAYLLPGLAPQTFHRDRTLSETIRVFWTPGHSPGSACLYYREHGGVLFTGRHLLPDRQGKPQPLRLSKTFHWPRQLRYSQQLLADFSPETLAYLCPGASTGFLRGEKKIADAYRQLQSIDWDVLKAAQPVL